MKIKRFQCGPIMENGYLIYQRDGGKCWIIDPGYRPELYEAFIDEHQLNLEEILLTHCHDDHIGAAADLMKKYECPAAMHEADMLRCNLPIDDLFEEGDVYSISDGSEEEFFLVLHTPGHTPGSVCFLSKKSGVCFTGDTLFDTDLGRTDLPGGNEEEMVQSVKLLNDQLSDDIHIFPGHEGDSTMKDVRKFNTEFQALLAGKSR
ncbi:MAG: MBL fold metallo-hydrolase [Eubacterium sp.]